MINTRFMCGLALFLISWAMISCAPKRPAIERNHYILEASRDQQVPGHYTSGTIAVRDFSVSPGYQGREIIFRTGKNTVRADFYSHYFILPGPMIAQKTRAWIRESGLFSSVVPMSSHVNPDYILEGVISFIHGDIRNPEQPMGAMEISFLLLKDSGVDFEIVFHEKYNFQAMMKGPGADSLIEALNECLKEILASLEEDLATTLQKGGHELKAW